MLHPSLIVYAPVHYRHCKIWNGNPQYHVQTQQAETSEEGRRGVDISYAYSVHFAGTRPTPGINANGCSSVILFSDVVWDRRS